MKTELDWGILGFWDFGLAASPSWASVNSDIFQLMTRSVGSLSEVQNAFILFELLVDIVVRAAFHPVPDEL